MNTPISINQTIHDLEAAATSGLQFKLSAYTGKIVVLYFYPKDSTPGCTTQAIAFRDHYAAFQQANVEIFGISRDSLKSHENFKTKFSLPFELIADPEEILCTQFDVIKMKNMYGKQVRGIERSTFVIDQQGILKYEWRKVKVDGHAQTVLDFVKTL